MFWLILLLPFYGHSQPSSALLLKRDAPDQAVSPSTRRYRVSPKKKKAPQQAPELDQSLQNSFPEKQAPEESPEPLVVTEEPVVEKTVETAPEVVPEPRRSSFTDELQAVLLGGDFFELIEYKLRLEENDLRKNQLELALSPAAIYNDSSSDSSFRNYNSFSPGLYLGVNLWLTPFFGIHATHLGSSGAILRQITLQPITMEHSRLKWGLQFRRFFSAAAVSPSLTFRLEFSDSKLKVDGDSTERTGLQTKGIGLGLEAKIPTSPRYLQTYSLFWTPEAEHIESGSELNLKSGTGSKSTEIALSVGGEFIFSRNSVLFWLVENSYEKNSFKGESNKTDPKTGQKSENTSVDNSILMFSFGYRWGH